MERRKGTGMTTSATRPIATVRPLNSTAWPADSIEATIASWFSRPWARSSRHRVTISNE